MLLCSSLQITVLIAAVCVYTNANEDVKDSSKEQQDNKSTNIQCKVSSEGIKFDTEICNQTRKTILKVFVKDEYTAIIPTLSPTPEPTQQLLNTKVDIEEASPSPSSSEMSVIKEVYDEWEYEDWMYGETSLGGENVLEEEKKRHEKPERLFPHILPETIAESHSWSTFCKEAAKEDEKPIRVSDGSFHSKFEVAPGLGVYRFHATPQSWSDARAVCENEGAQLAVANSEEEANFLKSFHNRCPHILNSHFNDYQYLGVHDLYGEGKWETYAGDRLEDTGFIKWAFGQPDNAHHYGEDCLTLNRGGYFNDVPCWTKLPFTCEHA